MKKPVLIAIVFLGVSSWLPPASAVNYSFAGKALVWESETVDLDAWLSLTSEKDIHTPLFDQSERNDHSSKIDENLSWKVNQGQPYDIGEGKEAGHAPLHAPEPPTLLLLTTGLVGVVVIRRKRLPTG